MGGAHLAAATGERGADLLARAFAVREALGGARRLGIGELTAATGLPKTTVFRLVHALADAGYVELGEDGRYAIGLGFLKFAALFFSRNELRHAAIQPMRDLRARYGDTVNLAVFDGSQLVYLEILEGTHQFAMSARVGARVPMHATALGKAVGACLPDDLLTRIVGADGLTAFTPRTPRSLQELRQQLATARRDGFAVDDQEMEPGFRCVAAPILGHEGTVAGGLSLSGPVHRLSDAMLPAVGAEIRAASDSISRWLGFWPT